MKIFSKVLILFLIASSARAQVSPREHFGFDIGDDYQLTTASKTEEYFRLLDRSERAKFQEIGKTEEGRSQYMLIVSSPENLKDLESYRAISQKLARAEGISEDEARKLAQEGKAVVWIDGGLHATETLGIHQLIETAWQLTSRTDDETLKILDNTIILLVHANPDGHDLVSNWYMREPTPEKRSLQNVPRLYQKYAGHDNNRDFFMLNLQESRNMARQLFVDWLPQIMYNHHQSGPAGAVVAGAPFRDPFNYVFDPLIMTSIDALGAAINSRLNAENKPGYTQKTGAVYSTWYNGGLRTTTYFHNIIGLLTETIGGPNPSEIPLVPARLIPNGATTYPVTPQKWHFRQSIDYSISMNYAVLNYASRHRDELLYNIYRMGRNSIEKGSRDSWSLSPLKVDSINRAYLKSNRVNRLPAQLPAAYFDTVMRDPGLRDARAYIISADQPDFPSAMRFVNALIGTGIAVDKATASFTIGDKRYPKGSYVIKTDQAFRPHVLDMFEPQDHPNDFRYEGGPPIAPYDAAGWTLAYLMGIKFDKVFNEVTGPLSRLPYGEMQTPDDGVIPTAAGYILAGGSNSSFLAVNKLLKKGREVYRTPSGDFYLQGSSQNREILHEVANTRGLTIKPAAGLRQVNNIKVSPLRVALWDTYGGSMPSGWIRYIAEQFEFPIDVIYAQEIDRGNLHDRYDVLILVPGAIPAIMPRSTAVTPAMNNIPADYSMQTGRLTIDKSLPQLKKFAEDGGHIVALGSSTNIAFHLGLPVKDHITETGSDGKVRHIPSERFYVPGSVLRATVDTSNPAAWGMDKEIDVYFDNSPVVSLNATALPTKSVRPLLWFDGPKPLRSGWAWGQGYLQDGIAAYEADLGKGRIIAFGPEITFRAQTHGTFRLLFNQLYGSGR